MVRVTLKLPIIEDRRLEILAWGLADEANLNSVYEETNYAFLAVKKRKFNC